MTEKAEGKIHGRCVDCGGPTQLLEWDLKKGTRTLQCQTCGLLHHYKKDVFGWKLERARDMLSSPSPVPNVVKKKERFCRYCGAEVKTDAIFCEKCGKRVG